MRCVGKSAKGTQCRRKVCVGLPVCWSHAIKYYHVKIKDSEGRGKGVFAWNPKTGRPIFKKGDYICPYYGEMGYKKDFKRRREWQRKNGQNKYGVGIYELDAKEDKMEDGACQRGLGSIANAPNIGEQANARLMFDPEEGGYIEAAEDISHGEEILVKYGGGYSFQEPWDYENKRERHGPDFYRFPPRTASRPPPRDRSEPSRARRTGIPNYTEYSDSDAWSGSDSESDYEREAPIDADPRDITLDLDFGDGRKPRDSNNHRTDLLDSLISHGYSARELQGKSVARLRKMTREYLSP
jgi:hypothetical protein